MLFFLSFIRADTFKEEVLAAAASESSCIPENTVILVVGSDAHADLLMMQTWVVRQEQCIFSRYVLVLTDDKGYDNICFYYYSRWVIPAVCYMNPQPSFDNRTHYQRFIWLKYEYTNAILRWGVNVYLYDGDVVFLRTPMLDLSYDLSYQMAANPKGINDGQIGFRSNVATIAITQALLDWHKANHKSRELTQDVLSRFSSVDEFKKGTPFENITRHHMNTSLVTSTLFIKKPSQVAAVVTFHCNYLKLDGDPIIKLRRAVDIIMEFNKTSRVEPIPETIIKRVRGVQAVDDWPVTW